MGDPVPALSVTMNNTPKVERFFWCNLITSLCQEMYSRPKNERREVCLAVLTQVHGIEHVINFFLLETKCN